MKGNQFPARSFSRTGLIEFIHRPRVAVTLNPLAGNPKDSLSHFIHCNSQHASCSCWPVNSYTMMSLNTACRYAWECQTPEGGWGLDSVLREASWKLRGIVNGIDYSEWSPQADKFLRSDGYRNYDLDSMREGKAACKAALQRVCKSPSSSPPSLLLLLDLPSVETFLLHACLPVCVRSCAPLTDLNRNG